jgi:hypothetical protein
MNETATTPPPVGLVASLVTATGTLVRQELVLASTELGHKAKNAAAEIVVAWLGGLLGTAGTLMVALAVVVGLAPAVPVWISALALGLLGLGVGHALVQRSFSALHAIDPVPRRTAETLQTAGASMKETVR